MKNVTLRSLLALGLGLSLVSAVPYANAHCGCDKECAAKCKKNKKKCGCKDCPCSKSDGQCEKLDEKSGGKPKAKPEAESKD